MNYTERSLIIFIKNPIKGKAKTRLAATVGADEAHRIYLELLRHTREITEKVNAHRYLYYSAFIDENDDWSIEAFSKHLQDSDLDLGQKMSLAFQKAFNDGNQQVIIIGSDCASLTAEAIEDAFLLLDQHDFVVGPAEDGGYYLLGMQKYTPKIFQNIQWSTPEVFPKTLAYIENTQKTVGLLPTLSDIDYEEDWKQHGWEIA